MQDDERKNIKGAPKSRCLSEPNTRRIWENISDDRVPRPGRDGGHDFRVGGVWTVHENLRRTN